MYTPRSTQLGLSLIGLLIGLLISVLCILGSLTLYKNLVYVAAESKIDAKHDGQLAAAMLTVQMEVQNAGYGIEDADGDDVVTVTAAGEQKLLWRFTTDGGTTYQCRGLQELGLEEEGSNFRVLKLIEPEAGCTAGAALADLIWEKDISILGRWQVVPDHNDDQGLDDYIADNATLYQFGLAQAQCSPYGANSESADTHLQLTITAPSSALLQGADGVAQNTYEYCLPNTYPAI